MELVLMQDSCAVGFVLCDEGKGAVHFSAVCERALDGIWRAYLTDGSRECLIGVMAPDGNGRFCARKRYTKSALEQNGISFENGIGVLRFGRALGCAQMHWIPCRSPGELFRDDALKNAMKRAFGVLVDDETSPTRVAVPLKGGCGCAPALCLATYMEYQGGGYAVLGIDRLGMPQKLSEQIENSSV